MHIVAISFYFWKYQKFAQIPTGSLQPGRQIRLGFVKVVSFRWCKSYSTNKKPYMRSTEWCYLQVARFQGHAIIRRWNLAKLWTTRSACGLSAIAAFLVSRFNIDLTTWHRLFMLSRSESRFCGIIFCSTLLIGLIVFDRLIWLLWLCILKYLYRRYLQQVSITILYSNYWVRRTYVI